MTEDSNARVPWSTQPSLKEKAAEIGLDFDRFIECLSLNKSDTEIAEELKTPTEIVKSLRLDFEKYGIQSIEGQD